jgi:hypothetical protein
MSVLGFDDFKLIHQSSVTTLGGEKSPLHSRLQNRPASWQVVGKPEAI